MGEDKERNTAIINEEAMQEKLGETINASENANIIVDGHYASAVTPTEHVAQVFVLRRDPRELKQFMERCGYSGSKMWENLQAEIIDVVLGEAVEVHAGRVCEMDVTGKSVDAGGRRRFWMFWRNAKPALLAWWIGWGCLSGKA